MADCGATGSALDRAARAVLSTTAGGDTAKHVGNLLGHASIVQPSQAAMPVAAPNQIVLPGGGTVHSPGTAVVQRPTGTTTAVNPAMEAAWRGEPARVMRPHLAMQPHPMPHPQMLLQQQMNMMHLQHQQLNYMMQQQQQMQQAASASKLKDQSSTLEPVQQKLPADLDGDEVYWMKDQSSAVKPVQQEPLENWHQGIEEDLERYLDDNATVGHEGLVKGAGIEELAAAWAEAEAQAEADTEGVARGATVEELSAAWAKAQDEYDDSNLWTGEAEGTQSMGYEFANQEVPENPKQDWMEQGMRYFQQGKLKEAIHAFEMELQHSDPDNATAWRMLGKCHAENDQDREAIACLEQAVDRDPYAMDALLALGVSYVNELNHDRALSNLKAWITHNPKYAGMEVTEDVYGVASSTESPFEEVQRLLVRALEFDPTDSADIHEALGVVYNVSRDYAAAVNSFRKAIDSRPDDYQLWNKYGATLANWNQSEKALPAYHKALQLRPKYARAWLNMAISHSNLHEYDEAARCYLQTLSLNPAAVHCWSYLRIALSCSERWDLIPAAASQDLNAFREHYDFVMPEK